MSEAQIPMERIRLADVDDPRDAVHRAVACLARGGVLGVPTESEYALAASALSPNALKRLRDALSIDATEPLPIHLRGPMEIWDWAPELSLVGERFAYRAWPGPLSLRLIEKQSGGLADQLPGEARTLIAPAQTLAFNCSSHPLLRNIARLVSGPMIIASSPQVAQMDHLNAISGLDLVLDDGPLHRRTPPTVVDLVSDGWKARSLGAFDQAALERMAGTIILFVCTGNTCRSPMAEAMCKRMIADRLGCEAEELPGRGYAVMSAGVSASRGWPASPEAVAAVKRRKTSLDNHESQPVSTNLAASADLIFAMTYGHLDALLAKMPHLSERATLLDPEGGDVADPYGGDAQAYEDAARMIEEFLIRQLDRLGIPFAS